MKGYAMLSVGKTGWVEKDTPACGPLDAIVRPLALSPCTSDVHTVWEGTLGNRHNMILGHEAVGEVVETGARVREFKAGDRVMHAVFGRGEVIAVEDDGQKVSVSFESGARKRFSANIAPLRKVEK